ncbi:MAG: prepilin-type N-terminal cleavage/methylation domain-containing protein [Acidobacteria bacterium]|nr:MAG: prepilin-type N-terminal cleavage/methylation domain-containing protein [Acidobacteriota bacterium]
MSKSDPGFSLVELLMVMAIAIILMAIALPTLGTSDRTRVDNAAREVQQELQSARLRAVGNNRRLEVRFNCPATGQYRLVEAGWTGSDRCSPTAFPYPAPPDAAYNAKPRLDGPVRYLNNRVLLAASSSNLVIQFLPNGQTARLQGTTSTLIGTGGEVLTLSIGSYSRTVNVNGLGRVQLQ